MATVINNPPGDRRDDGGANSAVVTGIVIIVLVLLFFLYGLPRLRGSNSGTTNINVPPINVNTGGGNSGGTTGQ